MEPQTKKIIPHYYGDIVRLIFIIGAIFVLLGIPTMTSILNIPAIIPIISVAVLGITAGITNPVQIFSLRLNVVISIIFLMFFAYMGWYSYTSGTTGFAGFINQVSAVLFLIASYFSVKSLRGATVVDPTI